MRRTFAVEIRRNLEECPIYFVVGREKAAALLYERDNTFCAQKVPSAGEQQFASVCTADFPTFG